MSTEKLKDNYFDRLIHMSNQLDRLEGQVLSNKSNSNKENYVPSEQDIRERFKAVKKELTELMFYIHHCKFIDE